MQVEHIPECVALVDTCFSSLSGSRQGPAYEASAVRRHRNVDDIDESKSCASSRVLVATRSAVALPIDSEREYVALSANGLGLVQFRPAGPGVAGLID